MAHWCTIKKLFLLFFCKLYVFAVGVVENLFVFALRTAIVYDGLMGLLGGVMGIIGVLGLLLLMTVLLSLASCFGAMTVCLLVGSLLDILAEILDGLDDGARHQNDYKYKEEKYKKQDANYSTHR